MKVISGGYEIIDDGTYLNPLKKIERIAHICYESCKPITKDSYWSTVNKLIDMNNLPMFEHATLVYEIDRVLYSALQVAISDIMTYFKLYKTPEVTTVNKLRLTKYPLAYATYRYVVSGSIRTWLEFFTQVLKFSSKKSFTWQLYAKINTDINNLFNLDGYEEGCSRYICKIDRITDMSTLTLKERLIHETFTVIFTCDMGVARELRAIGESSAVWESRQYHNNQDGESSNELICIKPSFIEEGTYLYAQWYSAMMNAEKSYFNLLDAGVIPSQARVVLPMSVKTTVVITSNLVGWRDIYRRVMLDSSASDYSQVRELIVPLFTEVEGKYPIK